jgi:predicted secreted protein
MKGRFILILLCIAFASCKKDHNTNLQPIEINAQQNGKTVSLAQGQVLKITLGNPGDGGYNFDTPAYNSAVLSLKGHTHTASISNAVGDFGTDTWEFSTLKSGTSELTISATRGAESPIIIFGGNVVVN